MHENEEYWTIEHAAQMENKLSEAEYIYNTLIDTQKKHEKGGTFFETTKLLLESYRCFRFEIINEKLFKISETINTYDASNNNGIASLDNILAMPEVYKYYSKELVNFFSSNSPAVLGKFVHFVDSGLKVLKDQEDKKGVSYADLLKAIYIDPEQSPEDIAKQFKISRASFFNKKNEAITALSIIIFGPLGMRHPTYMFDENELMKKFPNMVQVSDFLDMFIDLMEVRDKNKKS